MRKLCMILIVLMLYSCSSLQNERSESFFEDYDLKWSDDFDGKQLDTLKWAYRKDNKHRSIQMAENISIKDGKLLLDLKVFKEPIEGKKIL